MLRALEAAGVRVLVIDDNSPDGTGEIADRLAAELDYVAVLHRERKEGLGPAYIAGFRRALADGAELVLEMDCDFSHDPADVPRLIAACRGRRRPRARLALRRRAAERRTGGSAGASSRPAAPCTRAPARRPRPRPDRRLQVLPPRRARDDRPRRDRRRSGYAFQIETTYRTLREGFTGRRGADHVRRPHGGRLEDEPRDRARGGLEGARTPASRPRGASVASASCARSPTPTFDAGRDRRAIGPVGRRLLGAVVPAVPRGRADPRAARREHPGKVEFAKLNIDEHPRSRRGYERAVDPDRDPVRGRRAAPR